MEPDVFAALLPMLAVHTRLICPHVLGEPLLHPRFGDFAGVCSEYGLNMNLTTNGMLLHRHDLLSMPALRQINFSLQALVREDDIDRHSLQDILAFCTTALRARPELYINLRLWTSASLQDTVEPPQTALLLDQIAAALHLPRPMLPQGRKSLRLTGRLYLHRDTVFDWPGTPGVQPRPHGFCHALSTHCAILVDGTVCPCCLDAQGSMPLGNVLQTPLQDILAGPRARGIVSGFADGLLVEETCRHCSYCQRFTHRGRHGQRRSA